MSENPFITLYANIPCFQEQISAILCKLILDYRQIDVTNKVMPPYLETILTIR